jgi:hypothetical protein
MTMSASTGREVIMYKVDAVRGSVRSAVELLADTIANPVFAPSEISHAKVHCWSLFSISLGCLEVSWCVHLAQEVIRFQTLDIENTPQSTLQNVWCMLAVFWRCIWFLVDIDDVFMTVVRPRSSFWSGISVGPHIVMPS